MYSNSELEGKESQSTLFFMYESWREAACSAGYR
jgi:hypothetical protein